MRNGDLGPIDRYSKLEASHLFDVSSSGFVSSTLGTLPGT